MEFDELSIRNYQERAYYGKKISRRQSDVLCAIVFDKIDFRKEVTPATFISTWEKNERLSYGRALCSTMPPTDLLNSSHINISSFEWRTTTDPFVRQRTR